MIPAWSAARGRRLATIAGLCLVGAGAAPAAGRSIPRARAGAWSAPVALAPCAAGGGPVVAFPSQGPSIPTGAGAILWTTGCRPAGAGPAAGAPELAVAPVEASGRATPAETSPLPAAWPRAGGLVGLGGGLGRLVVAASPTADRRAPAVILEGPARSPSAWRALLAVAAGPLALARSYVGSVAVVGVEAGPVLALRVAPFFRTELARPRLIPIGPGRVSALTAAIDYHGDVLLAWQQHGEVRGDLVHASGPADGVRRLGPAAAHPELRALASDAGGGLVAWSTAAGAGGGATRVYLARVGSGTAAERLAAYPDAGGVGRRPGALGMVRLSSENVLLAWTDGAGGRYVVRAAGASPAGRRAARRVSPGGVSAVLADLAAGPAGEAIAVFRTSPAGPERAGALWAERVALSPSSHVWARPAELVAPAGPLGSASVAVDPATDRAVAAWLRPGPRPRIEYATRAGAPGYRPLPLGAGLAAPRAPAHRLRIAGGVAAAVAALALLASAALRRRRVGRVSRRRAGAGDAKSGRRRRPRRSPPR